MFTLTQFNMLADSLADSFPHVDSKCLTWEYRKPRIVQLLKERKSDILCVEECDKFDELKQIFQDEYQGMFTKKMGDRRDGVAVFVRRHIEVMSTQQYSFKGCPQVAQFVKLKIHGIEIVLVATHLKSSEFEAKHQYPERFEQIRLEQVKEIVMVLESNAHLCRVQRVMIAGDFNEEWHKPALVYLHETLGMRNVYAEHYGDNYYTTNKKRTDRIKCHGIDHILHNGFLQAVDYWPLPPKVLLPNANHPSDHLPITVHFRLMDRWQPHYVCVRKSQYHVYFDDRQHLKAITNRATNQTEYFFENATVKIVGEHENRLLLHTSHDVDIRVMPSRKLNDKIAPFKFNHHGVHMDGVYTDEMKHQLRQYVGRIRSIQDKNPGMPFNEVLILAVDVKQELKEQEVKQPEVKEREVKQPEVKQPEVKEQEVKEQEVKQPEVKDPEVKQVKDDGEVLLDWINRQVETMPSMEEKHIRDIVRRLREWYHGSLTFDDLKSLLRRSRGHTITDMVLIDFANLSKDQQKEINRNYCLWYVL